MYLFCIKSYIFCVNLCKYFEENIKRVMQINGVYEYTETCHYEANKIHLHLAHFEANLKKFEYGAAP
jgi:hypothetical protein